MLKVVSFYMIDPIRCVQGPYIGVCMGLSVFEIGLLELDKRMMNDHFQDLFSKKGKIYKDID